MIKKVFAAVMVLLFSRIDAITTIDVRFSEQGYWYAKAINRDPDLPGDSLSKAFMDSMALKSKRGLDFFQNKLPKDSHELSKLEFWAYVCSNGLKVPEVEKEQLRESAGILEKSLRDHIALFDSIKKFWGITENTPIYVFPSKTNDKQSNAGGFTVNFVDESGAYSAVLTCLPPFGEKISFEEHMGIIAHEFSHSMCAAHNKKCDSAKLKTIESRIAELSSKNAIVASWFLDETMAVVLGNGIFCEKTSGKRPAFKGSESCEPAGLAAAVYDLVLRYFDSSRSIDDDFLREYVRIFDEICPNAYIDPKTCLAHVSLIIPNDLQEDGVFSELFQQFHPSDINLEKFDDLSEEKQNEISQSNSSLLIVFENERQLEKIAHLIPAFDKTKPINIVHENKRTYIFIRIDAAHPFKERLKELTGYKI